MTDDVTIPAPEYDRILALHPWIRSRDRYAYLCCGWVDLLRELLDALDSVMAEHPGAAATDWYTKEKFGGLRIYFRLTGARDPDSLWLAIRGPIDSTEDASLRTCEVCGAPGRPRDAAGWFVTRCDEHAPRGAASE